jgi:mxaJ protein
MTSPHAFSLCVFLLTASALAAAADAGHRLRVCADPDNLPFSNDRFEGFENKIAQLVADDLHASLQYTWLPMSAASISQTLNAGKCDLIIGAPAGWGPVLTTKPYYASTYVFVYPRNKHPGLNSFDDPALRKLKIGLPLISGGGSNPPPAYALARRGLAGNVIGFPLVPPDKIVEAVASGEVDAAVVWGPLGGYFAKQQRIGLAVTPVSVGDDDSSLRFTYEISMGVKRENTAFKEELEHVLERRQKEIRKVLENYGVPVVSMTGGGPMSAKATY